MLLEFNRVTTNEFGEDDADGETTSLITINSQYISAVFASGRHDGACIVRMSDGRGFIIRGSYADIMHRLRAGSQPTAMEAA